MSPNAPSPDPAVQEAVRDLLRASQGFRDAYDRLARSADPARHNATVREAERRLDEARTRVHDAEVAARMRVDVHVEPDSL